MASSLNRNAALPYFALVILGIAASLIAGERVNFLIVICSCACAIWCWRPKLKRVFAILLFSLSCVIFVASLSPNTAYRFTTNFVDNISLDDSSAHYRAIAPAFQVVDKAPILGIGPGNYRYLCPEFIRARPNLDCHPHPHNFYVQMMSEAGIVGLLVGAFFLGSIFWACLKPAIQCRKHPFVATFWIVPFAFFWPIATTADFFGQWNNVFMWSALALALAGAQIGGFGNSASKI